jgi:16S rRNA (uracil1498-N3)-methyltransferase
VPVPGLHEGRNRLDPATSHHLLHVLRLPRGAELAVGDGAGATADARLVDVEGGCAVIEVVALRRAPSPPTRVVLLGVPKPALVEEAVLLGTEDGATRFLLVRADRSPPGTARPERLERILAGAAEQCGRAELPTVRSCGLAEALAEAEGARWLAEPGADPLPPVEGAATVAIGPEGGWSEAERGQILEAGFLAAGLGAHVLRAPTAVAVALGRLHG